MTKPKTRWDICENCLGESNHDKALMEECKHHVQENRNKKWQNPLFNVVMNKYHLADGKPQGLCVSCRFVLEHSILVQELSND